jgi:hypothetical protein
VERDQRVATAGAEAWHGQHETLKALILSPGVELGSDSASRAFKASTCPILAHFPLREGNGRVKTAPPGLSATGNRRIFMCDQEPRDCSRKIRGLLAHANQLLYPEEEEKEEVKCQILTFPSKPNAE